MQMHRLGDVKCVKIFSSVLSQSQFAISDFHNGKNRFYVTSQKSREQGQLGSSSSAHSLEIRIAGLIDASKARSRVVIFVFRQWRWTVGCCATVRERLRKKNPLRGAKWRRIVR